MLLSKVIVTILPTILFMYIVIVQPPPAVMRRAAATKEKAVSRIVLCGGDVARCGVGGHKIKTLRNKKTTIASTWTTSLPSTR